MFQFLKNIKSNYFSANTTNQIPLNNSYSRAFLNQPYSNAGRFGWGDIQAAAAWRYYSSISVVRHAIDMGAMNFQTVPYAILDTDTDIMYPKYDPSVPATGILNLLREPNEDITASEMKRNFYSSYNVVGDLYLLVTSLGVNEEPSELFYVNSKTVSPVMDSNHMVKWYDINYGQFKGRYIRKELSVDEGGRVIYINEESDSQLWVIKAYNPNDQLGDPTGLSPLSSLFYELEQLQSLSINNNALLRNGLRPGLALMPHKQDEDMEPLTDEQIENIRQSAIQMYAGPENASNVMVLDGISSVSDLTITSRDMEFKEMRTECIMQVYRNLNIPLPFINQDSQTYSNYAEAKLSFYDMSIIPFALIIAEELDRFLMPMYDRSGRYQVIVDKERIPVVSELRKEKENELKTLNERRDDIGLKAIDKDFIMVGKSPIQLSGEGMNPEPQNQEETNEEED